MADGSYERIADATPKAPESETNPLGIAWPQYVEENDDAEEWDDDELFED